MVEVMVFLVREFGLKVGWGGRCFVIFFFLCVLVGFGFFFV